FSLPQSDFSGTNCKIHASCTHHGNAPAQLHPLLLFRRASRASGYNCVKSVAQIVVRCRSNTCLARIAENGSTSVSTTVCSFRGDQCYHATSYSLIAGGSCEIVSPSHLLCYLCLRPHLLRLLCRSGPADRSQNLRRHEVAPNRPLSRRPRHHRRRRSQPTVHLLFRRSQRRRLENNRRRHLLGSSLR